MADMGVEPEQGASAPAMAVATLTRSLISFPQQTRLLELGNNADGTLSIFGTVLDRRANWRAGGGTVVTGLTNPQLRSISRLLTANIRGDVAVETAASGSPYPAGNVELVLADPRR